MKLSQMRSKPSYARFYQRMGVTQSITFEDIQIEWQAENIRRYEAAKKGAPIYGPRQRGLVTFYRNWDPKQMVRLRAIFRDRRSVDDAKPMALLGPNVAIENVDQLLRENRQHARISVYHEVLAEVPIP